MCFSFEKQHIFPMIAERAAMRFVNILLEIQIRDFKNRPVELILVK